MLRYPRQHFSVVVLSNLAQFDSDAMANKVARTCLRDQMTLPVARGVAPGILKSYAGRYEFELQAAAEVTIEGRQLWIQLPGRPRQKLLAESESRFFAEDEEYVKVEFNRDADDKVVSLTLLEGHRTAPKVK